MPISSLADFELHQSSLTSWLRCPQAFYFNYIEGGDRPTAGAAFLGAAVHYAINIMLKNIQAGKEALSLDDVHQAYNQEFDSGEDYRRSSPRWDGTIHWVDDDLPAESKQLGWELLRSGYPSINKIQPVLVELALHSEIEIESGALKIGGRIDAFDVSGSLIDFKTAGRAYTQRTADATLQLTFYAMLLRGPTSAAMHILVKNAKRQYQILNTHRDENSILFLRQNIIEPFVKTVSAGIFWCCDPDTNYLCTPKYCFNWDRCNRSKLFSIGE